MLRGSSLYSKVAMAALILMVPMLLVNWPMQEKLPTGSFRTPAEQGLEPSGDSSRMSHSSSSPLLGRKAKKKKSRSHSTNASGSNEDETASLACNSMKLGFHQGADQAQSCRSRHERPAFWKNSQEADDFLAAVDAYESYHARCTNGVSDWSEHLARETFEGSEYSGCKYVIYVKGGGGFGSRLLGLSSTFLYGLLTQRAMIVPCRANGFLTLLCNPFRNSSWWIDFDAANQGPELGEFLRNPQEKYTGVRINLDMSKEPQFGGAFTCFHTQKALRKVTWVSIQAHTWLVPTLHANQRFRSTLARLFPDNVAFSPVAQYLLQPSDAVWQSVKRAHAEFLEPADLTIGLQLRTFVPTFDPEVVRRSIVCITEGLGLPPPRNWDPSRGTSTSPSTRRRLGTTEGQAAPRKIVIFLATMSAEYYMALRDAFTEAPLTDGSSVSLYVFSSEGKERWSIEQEQKAFTEIHLLSMCDHLITSYASGFGQISAGFFGNKPWKLNIADRKGDRAVNYRRTPHPICLKAASTEPCQELYLRVHCFRKGNVSLGEREWRELPDYMQPCVDFPAGYELPPSMFGGVDEAWNTRDVVQ